MTDRHLLTRLTVQEQRKFVAICSQSCSIELLEKIAVMLFDDSMGARDVARKL